MNPFDLFIFKLCIINFLIYATNRQCRAEDIIKSDNLYSSNLTQTNNISSLGILDEDASNTIIKILRLPQSQIYIRPVRQDRHENLRNHDLGHVNYYPENLKTKSILGIEENFDNLNSKKDDLKQSPTIVKYFDQENYNGIKTNPIVVAEIIDPPKDRINRDLEDEDKEYPEEPEEPEKNKEIIEYDQYNDENDKNEDEDKHHNNEQYNQQYEEEPNDEEKADEIKNEPDKESHPEKNYDYNEEQVDIQPETSAIKLLPLADQSEDYQDDVVNEKKPVSENISEHVPAKSEYNEENKEQVESSNISGNVKHKAPKNSKFKKEEGKEKHAKKHELHKEKGSKDYKQHHVESSSKKGHHDKEEHAKKYNDHGGSKKKHHEEKEHYGQHHKGETGKKDSKYEEGGKHEKGHSTKGEHNIEKKDEYNKKHEFYEEHHEGGDNEKEGGFHFEDDHKKGGHKKGSHGNEGKHKNKYGKESHYKKGHHYDEDFGHKKSAGHDSHHAHDTKYGKKGGKSGHKKWHYEKGDGHPSHSGSASNNQKIVANPSSLSTEQINNIPEKVQQINREKQKIIHHSPVYVENINRRNEEIENDENNQQYDNNNDDDDRTDHNTGSNKILEKNSSESLKAPLNSINSESESSEPTENYEDESDAGENIEREEIESEENEKEETKVKDIFQLLAPPNIKKPKKILNENIQKYAVDEDVNESINSNIKVKHDFRNNDTPTKLKLASSFERCLLNPQNVQGEKININLPPQINYENLHILPKQFSNSKNVKPANFDFVEESALINKKNDNPDLILSNKNNNYGTGLDYKENINRSDRSEPKTSLLITEKTTQNPQIKYFKTYVPYGLLLRKTIE